MSPTPWASLSVAPFPPRCWSPPPGQRTQPEPPPRSEAWSSCSHWAPAPSLGPQEVPAPPTGCRGGELRGGRKRREERQLGRGRAEQPRGAGAEKGAGSGEAGWRAGGRRGRGRLCRGSGGDKFSGPAAARPLTWVPVQAPSRCLRRSVGAPGRPRASGPGGSGLGPGRPGEQACPPTHPPPSPPPRVPAGGRARRRAGREEGRKERAASERAELAEGASEGRQAVRSSFESNCLSQEEMWHSMQGEGRGKGPSRLRAGAPPHTQGRPRPPFPRPGPSCLGPIGTNPCRSHSGLTSAAMGAPTHITPRERPPFYSLGVMGTPSRPRLPSRMSEGNGKPPSHPQVVFLPCEEKGGTSTSLPRDLRAL